MPNMDFYIVPFSVNTNWIHSFLNLNILFSFSSMTLIIKEHGELLKVTAATFMQPDSETG
jgi:hypothetical protein